MKIGSTVLSSPVSPAVFEEQTVPGGEGSPTRMYEMRGGSVAVSLFGRPTDYTRILQNPEGKRVIAHHAAEHGVKRIFAPRASDATAQVIDPNLDLFPDKEVVGGVEILYGALVDGVRLMEPKTAFFVASGDCPTLVVRSVDGTVTAAHCALSSLVHPERYGREAKKNRAVQESVIDQIFNENLYGLNSEAMTGLFCGIAPENYEHWMQHQEHGKTNQALINFLTDKWGEETVLTASTVGRIVGQISLRGIVKEQMRRYGVRVDFGNFFHDRIDTFDDMTTEDDSRQSAWWSHRWYVCGGSCGVDGRNGVLVMRKF